MHADTFSFNQSCMKKRKWAQLFTVRLQWKKFKRCSVVSKSLARYLDVLFFTEGIRFIEQLVDGLSCTMTHFLLHDSFECTINRYYLWNPFKLVIVVNAFFVKKNSLQIVHHYFY